ncbi:proteoglycan 4 isoform X2 [Choloepus didactylus]|uniref:proteoglycan 4 isoform X2 n=1 Tax=Choloepus didactylus TaxID=27675 RepID=UPI00189EBD83|nr:proteoglycan 4 isoform X2 [Choloepus didactylus]
MEWKILPIYLLLLSVFSIQQASSQGLPSCAGRCGEVYSRDAACNCDYNCQHYMECCPDFKKVCTEELSCKGRCFESFVRGRECDCDAECKTYGKCCSDYVDFCEEDKKRITKKRPTPEAPVVDEAGSGLDNGDFKLTPTPDIPTTQNNKVSTSPKITTVKPKNPKPSLPPGTSTAKVTSKETSSTIKTKDINTTNRQTSASTKEKTTSAKETQSAEKTSAKDSASTSEVSTPKAETTTKAAALVTPKQLTSTTTKVPIPTTPKKPAPTTSKVPIPTTPKVPAPTTTTPKAPIPTTKESAPTTPKVPTPTTTTTPKVPAPTTPKVLTPTTTTTPKVPAPTTTTTPKAPIPTTPKKPAPTTTPKVPAPTTPRVPTPSSPETSNLITTVGLLTTPKTPVEPTPEFPVEPTPKAPEKDPKEPALPTTKAADSTKPEMTTIAKEKTTEKAIHTTSAITTIGPKITTKVTATTTEEKTTESKITSTTMHVTSTTTEDNPSLKITPNATIITPKVTTTKKTTTKTEETMNKPKEVTAKPKDTATSSQVTTPKPQTPTKAPQKPNSTQKPTTTPKVRKPMTTTPSKMTISTVPELNPASLDETMLQTTTSSNQRPNSDIVEVNSKNEDADTAEGEKPYLIPRPPVFIPIPGLESRVISINPMFSDETNLCNGKPVDGLTTLYNGTLVAFRGHYFWMLNPSSPPSPARRITEVWGIPSPIDTVFTRCNCERKTFFFKDSQYWRFTNDKMDAGYPKQIVKGFGGLNGNIVAALSIATYKNRPESVYFFKRGGRIQQYTYKQEPTTKCTGRRPAINYSVYGETTHIRRRRFERAIGPSQTHTIRIQYLPVRADYQVKGFLDNEDKVSTLWRGFPSMVTSAVSLPNIRKPDGYDYYAFSKDQYYNIDVPSRTARPITTHSGKTLSKVWYNCP